MNRVRTAPRILAALLSAAIVSIGITVGARAQLTPPPGPPELWVQVEDSVWVSRIFGRDTLAPLEIGHEYRVEMLNDSTCATRYVWSDCRVNSTPLRFYHWHGADGRIVSAAADLLSYNTRTVPVQLHAGDTITYFRHFYWYDPTNRGPRLDGYSSRDTLSYAIELVRTRDSLRVAMLDSMGVMPRILPGVPSIHGTRPPLALVTYIVPPALNGETAFLRLRLYDRGDGEYYFERYDRIGLGARRTLADPNWIEYLRAWGAAGKRAVAVERTAGVRLEVTADAGELVIRFSRPTDDGATGIAIYDAGGRPVFYPYLSPGGEGDEIVRYRPDAAGVYLVGLLHHGELVATQKAIITR